MNKLVILLLYFLLTVTAFPYTTTGQVLDPAMIGSYIDRFNMQDKELYVQHISNGQAKEFLSGNIPLFECPDKNIEEIYYFRWWTFRKHLKKTPDGFIVTEFLPDVPWAGKHNGIQRARTAEVENLTDATGPVDYACCGVGEQNTQYAGNERASAGTTEQPREDAAA